MSETLSSAFQISLLRNGVNAYIEKSVVRWDDDGNESAGSLLQIYDSGQDKYSVDWTVEANQPILKLDIVTSSGTHPTIASAAFTYDGDEVDFSGTQVTLNDLDWDTDTTGRFAYRHYTVNGVDTVLFRVITNLAEGDNLTDALIGYVLTFSDSDAGSGTLQGTEEVHLHDGGSSSFSVNISSEDTTFNSETEVVTLTASAYRGVAPLTIGTDFQIVWFKNGLTYMGVGETLEVQPSDVYSTAVFTAYLTDDVDAIESDGSGDWDKLASDSERVTDTTDPYRLVDSYKYGGAVNATQTETLTVGVYSGEEQVTSTTATFVWEYTMINCVKETVKTGEGTSEELTVDIAYADTAYTNTVTVDGEETTSTGHGGVTINVGVTMTFS